jgi:hypothetical protein
MHFIPNKFPFIKKAVLEVPKQLFWLEIDSTCETVIDVIDKG